MDHKRRNENVTPNTAGLIRLVRQELAAVTWQKTHPEQTEAMEESG